MGGVRVLFAALCLAGPLWLAATMPAHACSCGQLTTAERVARTDVIVIGTPHDLRAVGDIPTPEFTPVPGETPAPQVVGADVEWTVDVEEYLKGSGPSQIDVGSSGFLIVARGTVDIQPGTTPACGFAPEEGVRYLLFVDPDPSGKFVTGACDFNMSITSENEQATAALIEEIRAILRGPPVDAFPDTGAGPPRDGSSVRTIAVAGAIGATLAGAVLLSPLVFRRREP